MKVISRIVLFLFLVFMATPAIVTIIEKKLDISVFYSFTEEENSKETKEIKEILSEIKLVSEINLFKFSNLHNKKTYPSIVIISDSILDKLFSPPPELV